MINSEQMDTLIPLVREKQKIRDAEFAMQKSQQILENNLRENELQKLKEQTHQYAETIEKNLTFITSHRHAISKAVHESKQCVGLPISNKYHKQTLDFINDAVTLLNNGKKLYAKPPTGANIDAHQMNANVQSCAESTSQVFKGTQSSVNKVETFMQNMHLILDQYSNEEPALECSIFDE